MKRRNFGQIAAWAYCIKDDLIPWLQAELEKEAA
jgi:hypothetical protein